MRRSRTAPDAREMENQLDTYNDEMIPFGDEGSAIVRSIASFLTLSDAASLASIPAQGDVDTPTDSWAVGVELESEWSWSVATPLTPALVALSPGATPHPQEYHVDGTKTIEELEEEDSEYMEEILQERRRRWAQEKLAAAVFSHPRSLRSFCMEAYLAAKEIRMQQEEKAKGSYSPETLVEPTRKRKRSKKDKQMKLVYEVADLLFHNVPLSVLIDVIEAVGETSLDTTFASFHLTASSINAVVSALGQLIVRVWDGITNLNPFQLLEAIISLQFNAMGKTSEVLASGIQSVATGVGSASSLALHRLSAANLSVNRTGSSSSLRGDGGLRRNRSREKVLNKKLLKKLSSINAAARVVSYTETGDDTGGLTKHAKHRVQRMMHYDVSLRPFRATVENSRTQAGYAGSPAIDPRNVVIDEATAPRGSPPRSFSYGSIHQIDTSSSSSSPNGSPFMCTPQSFPPTPNSRQMVLARGSRFADDIVFLARDRLRLHRGVESENERTREMANALREGKRLAVFDAKDVGNGIELTCGQHIATKVSNMLYASARSMVPVLRNCYVYFEMAVLPRPDAAPQTTMATLSIGLATEEMPPNTLVGAWQGSVGLCSTGQILTSGQWCSPVDLSQSCYGDGATVGCLVSLDDGSAFETWDGVMVTALVTFTVNGVTITQPNSKPPMPGSFGQPPSAKKPRDEKDVQLAGETQSDSTAHDAKMAATSLPLLVPAAEDLYPTITLHSPATAVMCRFSAEDIIAVSRDSIGAPESVAVYAVDGSVIFNRDE